MVLMLTIENEFLKVSVNPLGAELSAVTSQKDGYEFMWSGDPDVWSGHSPLLFPVVGRLKGDRYEYEGKSYSMPKHGFIQREQFDCTAKTDTSLTLTFDRWETYESCYPFRYRLDVIFTLKDGLLFVSHKVSNLQEKPMYFSLGAHPAFRCLPGGYLEFEKAETLQAHRFDDQKIIRPEKDPFLNKESVYRLLPHTFDDDAYVLEGFRSSFLWVRNPAENRSVKVHFGGAPYLGIWAKPAAPYVCIEPWFGLDDDYEQSGVLREKKGIVALPPKETFTFTYSIEPSVN